MAALSVLLLALTTSVTAQIAGTQTPETHPSMNWQECTAPGSCSAKAGKVVLDSNWRWLHQKGGTTNCYDGNTWSCASNSACTSDCEIEGADYSGTYGVTAGGNSLTLKYVTKGQYSTNIGSRMYMMEDDNKYQIYKLLDKEFTFDVDLSQIPCGLNSALYFVSMDADGGVSQYKGNTAGPKYGTGYCDAQCPRDLKFIGGEANAEGWTPSDTDKNAGAGGKGACCAEMDVWEANSVSTAVTPHSCQTEAYSICEGDDCGGTYSSTRYAGICDPDGCDFNSFRMGDKSFYGKGKTVDTSGKITVVTQFLTGGSGTLSEIKRFYVINGKVIPNSESKILGVTGNSLNEQFCTAQKSVFGDQDIWKERGGWASMSRAMEKGMVLVMSLWGDHYANMLWLDSNFPTEKDSSQPGIARGECPTSSGKPDELETSAANAQVTFSNIKFGAINSTFAAGTY
ncbi:hypothetical protein P152DRAFT_459837 [Eremomyces bilateralis CBS 781.70]|uniref:Glucanase n=1 Tax=Eremomyces bilateralis CBS 781.70 TaxID=1392243 RepID=A0A6G1FYV0_9PEZI|nr:uncharacterized protein P152DRAFT_459837 [Eremomyces bilateralis CBS 781.70]KAF1810963.1 hypothetical protein P152DRAFT_459837 [Eremomyces bilateralis CBS 781.70]